MDRQDAFTDEMLAFLDSLPAAEQENMFLTIESLLRHYPHLSAKEAQDLLLNWIQTAEAAIAK